MCSPIRVRVDQLLEKATAGTRVSQAIATFTQKKRDITSQDSSYESQDFPWRGMSIDEVSEQPFILAYSSAVSMLHPTIHSLRRDMA